MVMRLTISSARSLNGLSFPITYDRQDGSGRIYTIQPNEQRTLRTKNGEVVTGYNNNITNGSQEQVCQLSPALITNERPDSTATIPVYYFVSHAGTVSVQAATPTTQSN